MTTTFDIKHDYEFYVWLKSNLPGRFHIESQPSSAYYSEWMYCYKLYDGEELLETIEGDFRETQPGTLVRKAIEMMDRMEKGGR